MSSTSPNSLKLKNKYGKVAIEIGSVRVQGDVIEIKGEALGSMPITVNITADDLWEARHFVTWPVIRKVPTMFVRGWRQSRKAPRHPEPAETYS
jgi:hypothetical protein